MPKQNPMRRSTVNPGNQSMSTSGQHGSNGSRLYISRMGSYASLARGGSRAFSGSKSMTFQQSKIQHIVTTLKEDLEKSRVLPSEMFQTQEVIGGDYQQYLFSTLFSTSEQKRLPQTDVEFRKRAREVVDEDMSCGSVTGSSDVSSVVSSKANKKARFDELMNCLGNCGFEIDQEEKFNADKLALLKTRHEYRKFGALPQDESEPEE